MPPTPTLSPLKTATRALLAAVGDLDTAAGDATNPSFKAALELSTKLWAQVQDQAKGATTSSIVDFFHAIGSGVIDAQKKLDQASEQYIRGALHLDAAPAGSAAPSAAAPPGSPPALGAIFRIPRVTAELKCSLETDHEKKFNVILYSERNDARDFHQQTVQLEVVAVPVPPDYLNYLAAHPSAPAVPSEAGRAPVPAAASAGASQTPPPASAQTPEPVIFSVDDDGSKDSSAAADSKSPQWLQSYLVDDAAREEVRALIEKLDAKQSGKRTSVVRKQLLPEWSRAVVLTDGHNARFVLLATEGKPAALLLWQLVLRPASLQLLGKVAVTRLRGADFTRMHRLMAQLGKAQAAAGRRR